MCCFNAGLMYYTNDWLAYYVTNPEIWLCYRENPGVHTSHISKLMGQNWRQLTAEEQQPYRYKLHIEFSYSVILGFESFLDIQDFKIYISTFTFQHYIILKSKTLNCEIQLKVFPLVDIAFRLENDVRLK